MSYLRYLCLYVISGVQHILCCIFLRLVYTMLPVSLNCPYFIATFTSFKTFSRLNHHPLSNMTLITRGERATYQYGSPKLPVFFEWDQSCSYLFLYFLLYSRYLLSVFVTFDDYAFFVY